MTAQESKFKEELEALSLKFPALWSKVYFLSLSHTFSINLPGITNNEVPILNEFCEKNNVWWTITAPSGAGERGISIMFYNTPKQ